MALEVAAILAVLAAVQKVAQVKMITRLLEHASHATLWTRWDDLLVDALCDVPETEIPAKVDELQARYETLPAEERAALKAHSPTLLLAGEIGGSPVG